MNRYLVGAIFGAILGVLYAWASKEWTDRPNFEQAFSIFLATMAGVVAAKLFQEVTALKPNQLGALEHEHNSVILSLAFSMAYAAYSICVSFYALTAPAENPSLRSVEGPQAWLYHDWGDDGDCSMPLVLRRGGTEMALIFLTGDRRYDLQIIEPPTSDRVVTSSGVFARHDSTMTYDQMKKKKFTRCDK